MTEIPEPCLRKDESAGAGILRVCDELLADGLQKLRSAEPRSESEIHAVRIDLKFVRSLLRLLRPAMGEATFQRENTHLKKAAQSLAPLRDDAIALSTWHDLRKAVEDHQGHHVSRSIESRLQESTRGRRTAAIQSAARAISTVRKRLERLRLIEADRRAIELALTKNYRASRRRMKRAFAENTAKDFHRWRVRLKNFYYELQFLAPVWPKKVKRMLKELKEIQQYLGMDHDLAVLKSKLEQSASGGDPLPADSPIWRELNKRSRRLRRECQPPARKVFRMGSRKFLRRFDRHWETWRKAALMQQWDG